MKPRREYPAAVPGQTFRGMLGAMARIACAARHAAEWFNGHICADSLRVSFAATSNLQAWEGVVVM
jgi:hypothetical protein